MTQPNAYLQALEAICRWAASSRPLHELEEDSPLRSWIPSICEVSRIWGEVISDAAQDRLMEAFSEVKTESVNAVVSKCRETFGSDASAAINALHQELSRLIKSSRNKEEGLDLLSLVAARLSAEYESSLDLSFAQPTRTPAPQRALSVAQQHIGALVLDHLLGVSKRAALSWMDEEGSGGISVESLPHEEWTLSDRIYLSALILDGLSALHDQRLEPDEGFDPSKMSLSMRFEVLVPRGEPTRVGSLLSPERQRGESGGTPSDVWTLGKYLISLYTGQTLSAGLLDHDEQVAIIPADLIDRDEQMAIIPAEVRRVIERCLHEDPSERLYSAKEVRVVMTGPSERWLDRLSYESQQQESGESAAVTYEEVTAQREERDEVRAQRRRLSEINLRRALQWRASQRQTTIVMLFILAITIIYGQYLIKSAKTEGQRQARVEQAQRYADALDREDRSYQEELPKALRDLGLKWRYVSGDQELPAHLISTTEVTHAQYRVCVEAGSCEALVVQDGCVWGSEGHDEDPINCLTFYQARAFAKFSGGDLPTVEQWMWSATRDGAHDYPWGRGAITQEHANLDFDLHSWERGIRPIYQFRAGDSLRGVSDLVGSMSEWVIISETGEVGGYYELRTGVMGGSWLTSPTLVDLNRPQPMEAKSARYDVGVRVVKAL